jgi:predicted DNA binding CopG/RHH family protein
MAMYQPPFSMIKLAKKKKKKHRKKEKRINLECGSEIFFEVIKERSP